MREGVKGGKKHNYDGDTCRGNNRAGHTVTAVSNLGNDRNAGRGPNRGSGFYNTFPRGPPRFILPGGPLLPSLTGPGFLPVTLAFVVGYY
jgi:hypothetical protein